MRVPWNTGKIVRARPKSRANANIRVSVFYGCLNPSMTLSPVHNRAGREGQYPVPSCFTSRTRHYDACKEPKPCR